MTAAPGMDSEPRATAAPRTLYRSRTNRRFAGVCGGIAEYFGSDPTAVRLLTVILAILTGIVPLFVIYLIAAVIVPEGGEGTPIAAGWSAPRVAPGQGGLIVGAVLIGVGVLALLNRTFNVEWDLLWPVALVVLGGAILLAALRND
jgi:phage shock protein C